MCGGVKCILVPILKLLGIVIVPDNAGLTAVAVIAAEVMLYGHAVDVIVPIPDPTTVPQAAVVVIVELSAKRLL
jgi:hypothetical protein